MKALGYEEVKLEDLLTKEKFVFINEIDIPEREQHNVILNKFMLGIPINLICIKDFSGNITILNNDLNVIKYFYNRNINFKSREYTDAMPVDFDQLKSDVKNRFLEMKVNLHYFYRSHDPKIIKELVPNMDILEIEKIQNQ